MNSKWDRKLQISYSRNKGVLKILIQSLIFKIFLAAKVTGLFLYMCILHNLFRTELLAIAITTWA